mmetsp:Transcript_76501/g.206059  ORF Transcript_76501/g.206059 Transcript_76501/m.206059 type:complete len:297 (-) Transcript_76501:508-1398(-)
MMATVIFSVLLESVVSLEAMNCVLFELGRSAFICFAKPADHLNLSVRRRGYFPTQYPEQMTGHGEHDIDSKTWDQLTQDKRDMLEMGEAATWLLNADAIWELQRPVNPSQSECQGLGQAMNLPTQPPPTPWEAEVEAIKSGVAAGKPVAAILASARAARAAARREAKKYDEMFAGAPEFLRPLWADNPVLQTWSKLRLREKKSARLRDNLAAHRKKLPAGGARVRVSLKQPAALQIESQRQEEEEDERSSGMRSLLRGPARATFGEPRGGGVDRDAGGRRTEPTQFVSEGWMSGLN